MAEILFESAKMACYLLGLTVGAIILYVVVKYVVPWLKEKRLYGLLESLVAAAEREFEQPGDGPFKLEWVLEQVDKTGIKYNRELAISFINGLVQKLTASGVVNVDYFLVDKEFAQAAKLTGGETAKQNEAK